MDKESAELEALRIRRQMEDTRVALSDKLGALEQQVAGTVETVKDSVNTVRNSFDLKMHVQKRPLTLFAGAAALGLLLGYRSSAGRVQHRAETVRNIREARHLARQAREQPVTEANRSDFLASLGESFEKELSLVKGLAVGAVLGLVRDMAVKSVSGHTQRYLEDALDGVSRRLGGQSTQKPQESEPSKLAESEEGCAQSGGDFP